MKQKIILAFMIGIITVTAFPVYAQNKPQATSTRQVILEEKIEEKYNKIINRFEATIKRLELILSKIESRIAKIKSEGGDTSKAEKSLLDAKKYIEDSKTSLSSLKVSATVTANEYNKASSTKKTLKMYQTNLTKSSESTKKIMKQAQLSMVKIIGILEGLKIGQNASTTPKSN